MAGVISDSLGRLRELAGTFVGALEARRRVPLERKAVRLARELGDTAVPLLARKLAGGSEAEASWAYFLLAQIGSARVADAARKLTVEPGVADGRKALAVALLGELGEAMPEGTAFADPEGMRERSVEELVGRLSTPGDIARAAELLLERVQGEELVALLEEIARTARGGVAPLCAELLARDDVDEPTAAALAALLSRLPPGSPLPRPRGRATAWWARKGDDGSQIVVATRPADGGVRRVLVARVDDAGQLIEATHLANVAARGGLAELLDRVRADGFVPRRVPPTTAAAVVARAACECRAAGVRLPPGFFLGRDLLGLSFEHQGPGRLVASTALLDRAESLLEAGDAAAAARVVQRHVDAFPDDADGRALYGSCLLALGQARAALGHLAAAARLAPDEPIHHWNHSHAAKQCDRMGACYLALRRYLATGDDGDGARDRIAIARHFVALFERFARLEHPDAPVDNVARCEELFDRACAHLDGRRLTDAQSGFEAVLKLVPSHYQSWSNLGVVLLSLGERGEAERCLRRALTLRPDYEVAQKNLNLLARGAGLE